MEPRYRLVFAGRLAPGVDPERAIAALTERFRVRELTARKMIRGGGRHVLKHDLELGRARRYRATLEGMGLLTELEPQGPEGIPPFAPEPGGRSPVVPAANPRPEDPAMVDRAPKPKPGSTPCPKCGAVAVSPVSGVCDVCGVVAERYLARLAAEGGKDAGETASGPACQPPPGPSGHPPEEDLGETLWDPRSVASGRGWDWITEAWSQFRAQPWVWIGALLVFVVVSVVLGLVPMIGGLATGMLGPMLTGGLMIGAHSQWGGGRFEITHLLAGFSRNPGGLALLGVAYVGLGLILGLSIALALNFGVSVLAPDVGVAAFDLQELDPQALGHLGPLMLLPLLFGLLLGAPLMMAMFFAPALVAIDRVPAGRALWLSLLGCWRNLMPLLVFSLACLGLGILTVLTLGLALLVVMPLLTLALYHAYRDVYQR